MSLPFSLLERCRGLETNWNNVGASGENLLALVESIYKDKQEGALDYDEDDLLATLCDLFLSWPLQAASITTSELATHMKRGLQLLYTAYGVEGVTPVATTLTNTKITSLYTTWENLGPYGESLRTLCYAINEGADEGDQVTYTPADMAEALGGMAATMVLNPISLSFEDLVLIAQTGIDALIEDAGGEVVVSPGPDTIADQASQPTVPGVVAPNPGFGGNTQETLVVIPSSPYGFEVDGTELVAGGPYVYRLTNQGTLPIAWGLTGLPAWLTASAVTGSVEGKSLVTVEISLNAAGVIALASGIYTATLTFRDLTSNVIIPRVVTLDWTVPVSDPVLTFTPIANFEVSGVQGDPDSFTPLTKAYVVSNVGDVSGDWSVALSPSWITVAPVSPTSGTLAPGQSAIVRLTYDPVQAAAQPAGDFTGSITWTNVDTTKEAVLAFKASIAEDNSGGITVPVGDGFVGVGGSGAKPDPITFTPPGPVPVEEQIIKAGPFYDIYGQMTTRPYGRIELGYTKFEGPDCRVITLTWTPSGSKWAVVVDGVTVHNGTNGVSNPGFPAISEAVWNDNQTKAFIIGYCYRTFRSPSKTFHRINLTWVSGMPTFEGIGIGSNSMSIIGGGGSGTQRFLYHGDGSPVKNLLITATNLGADRVKCWGMAGSTAGGGYDGVVLRHLELGPDNDAVTGWSQGTIRNPLNNYNGFLAVEDCYFKPAPFTNVPTSTLGKFRDQYWGMRMYTPGGLLVKDCIFGNTAEMRLFGEHALYLSNCREFVFVEGCTAAVGGRTFIQVTNRRHESSLTGPNGGSGYGPIVITDCTHAGTFWIPTTSGGGSSFTIAGHLGPVYIDNVTIPATVPTLTPGSWTSRGGAFVFWAGGSHSTSQLPTTQDGGINWSVQEQGDSVHLDDLGFANSLIWVGKVDCDVSASGGILESGNALTTQSVRDFFLYVGDDQVIESAAPQFRLDYTDPGVGNADRVPHICYDGKVRILAVESESIRLFDTYEAGVTAPSITSVAPTAVFDDLVEGWVVKRPAGSGLNGTTITSLAWAFDSTEYDPMVPALNMSELQEYSTTRWFLAANLMASQWRETTNAAGNLFAIPSGSQTLTYTTNLAPASLTGTQAARLFFHDKNVPQAPYPFQGQTWILTWEGDVNARLYFDGNVTGGTITPSGRRQGTTVSPRRVSINVGTNNGAISIVLEPPYDSGSPISNLRFFPLSQEGNLSTTIFIPELLQHLDGVGLIRFMNVQQTNNASGVTAVSNRRPITACYQGGDLGGTGHGASLELMVELCNTTGADMWYCAPHAGDNALFTADAEYIADNLDIGLKCYVEYSNEVWNTSFTQRAYCLAQANILGYAGSDNEKVIKFQAKRSSELFAIFETEFGGLSRLVRVAGVQNIGAFPVTTFLDFVHDSPDTLADVTDMIAIAPYFGSNVAGDDYYAQSVNWTEAEIANHLRWRIAQGTNGIDTTAFWTNPTAAQAAATARGVAFGCYEGGQSLIANGQAFASTGPNAAANAALWARLANVNRSEAMGEITRAYMRCLKYRGVTVFPIYRGDVDVFGQFGSWGIGEYYGHNLPKEVAWREETGLVLG